MTSNRSPHAENDIGFTLWFQCHQENSKLGFLADHRFLLTNYHSHADVEEHHTVGEYTHEEASTNQDCPGDGGHPGS